MRLFGRGPGPIGIDLSGRTIRAAQLSGRPPAHRLSAWAQVPRRAEASMQDEAARLAGVLERQGFIGRTAVLAVPDLSLLTAVLDLPPRSSGAPVDQIALAEVSHMHRRDPASLELACWDLPLPTRGQEQSQAMAAACPHTDAEALLDAFEAAGFDIEALDVRAVALARACKALWAPEPAFTAVVDAGWDSALLSVVAGGVVIFERSLEACELRRLHSGLVAREGLPGPLADRLIAGEAELAETGHADTAAKGLIDHYFQTLGEQLGLSLAYIAHRYPGRSIGRILVVGEGSAMRGLSDRLSAAVEAPVHIPAPEELAQGVGPGAILAGAIGLASWAAGGHS
jgi:Tfp pilus assembly PilM family ATPase